MEIHASSVFKSKFPDLHLCLIEIQSKCAVGETDFPFSYLRHEKIQRQFIVPIRYDDAVLFTSAKKENLPILSMPLNVMKIFIAILYVNMLNMPYLASISNIFATYTIHTIFFLLKSHLQNSITSKLLCKSGSVLEGIREFN